MFDLSFNIELIRNTLNKGVAFSLDRSGVSDNHLDAIVNELNANPNITKLSMAATNIADSKGSLGQLKHIKELDVRQTNFSNKALVSVCQCEELTKLMLGTLLLTEDTVQQLKAIVRKHTLELVFDATKNQHQQERREEVVNHFNFSQKSGAFHVSPTISADGNSTPTRRDGILTSCCQRLMNFSLGTPGGKEADSPITYVQSFVRGEGDR